MHEQNIETLRDEALRLVDLQLKVLRKMLDEPGVLSKSQVGESQTFDLESTPKEIEILEGEKTKLERLELVLAVVGTMKAGKSTTINAIVGTEVLPNRNRPMTALPTLIKHTPGQIEPILKFENSVPIEFLIKELSRLIKLPENTNFIEHLSKNEHMEDLLELINTQAPLKKTYKGARSIFQFLETLNDLVRLSRALDVDFPFSDYNKIYELPVIKVEFVHLREQSDSAGTLTLLDTPGPNESGQPHLREMLKDQLSKASAILAVLDFTQLKSDADAQVRDNLKNIANIAEGRLYALVNKFDQKDRNSDSAEETRSFVANSLMEGKIAENLIFPVSSKFAYLANYARRELAVHCKLPDHHEYPWVEDFGNVAFGQFWEESITDLDDVKKCADRLWNRSFFHAPLENIIQSAHAQAALLAVESASSKLVETSKNLGNFLNTRETALTKSSHVLKKQINNLQQDVSRVNSIENDAKEQADEILLELERETNRVFETVKKNALESIEYYFKEGKQEEAEEYNRRLAAQQSRENTPTRNQGIIVNVFLALRPKEKVREETILDFDPNSPILKFTDKQKAQQFVKVIHAKLDKIVRENESIMKQFMNLALTQFQNAFSNTIIINAKEVVNDMELRMKQSGFSISLSIPDASLLSLETSGSDLLADLVDERTKSVTKRRRKDSWWGSICRWFDTDDWGWEEYESQQKYFEINIEKIKLSAKKDIERIFNGLDKDIAKNIKQPLQAGITDFFNGFRKIVEQIRGDLLQSIRDQEGSKAEKEALAKKLADLKKNVPEINKDSSELRKDMRHKIYAHTGFLA